MYSQIFNVVGPIFVMTFIGYVLGRTDRNIDTRTISTIVLLIATPCLIFSTLTSLDIDTGLLFKMAFAAALAVSLSAIFALPILKAFNLPVRAYLTSLTMPNSGNIGLPLVLLAFGEEGLALGICYFFVVALLQYTVGAAIMSGQYRPSDLAKQPLIYAILLVLIVLTTGLKVPTVIATTVELLGGMMIPAMLIMLGASLAQLGISDLKPAIIIALSRIVVGILTGLAVIFLLSLSGTEAGTVFLMAAMPAAIINYVFAERYYPDSQKVAGAVLISTLATFAILPAILWFALQIAVAR